MSTRNPTQCQLTCVATHPHTPHVRVAAAWTPRLVWPSTSRRTAVLDPLRELSAPGTAYRNFDTLHTAAFAWRTACYWDDRTQLHLHASTWSWCCCHTLATLSCYWVACRTRTIRYTATLACHDLVLVQVHYDYYSTMQCSRLYVRAFVCVLVLWFCAGLMATRPRAMRRSKTWGG